MRGAEGPMGLTGPPGPEGPTGVEGSKGEQGDQGEPVSSVLELFFNLFTIHETVNILAIHFIRDHQDQGASKDNLED